MAFHLKQFLRRTPATVVRAYARAKCKRLDDGIDWQRPAQTTPEAIADTIQGLLLREREAVISDFEQVHRLSDEIGQRALHSVIVRDSHLLSLLQGADSDQARAMLVLLEAPELFDHALAAAYADRMRNGRFWNAFRLNGEIVPDAVPLLGTFADEISAVLHRPDGSIGKLKLDRFERDIRGSGTIANPTIHYAIYREELPVSDIQFEGNDLSRQTRYPVGEAAILYDPIDGSIDVMASGGKEPRRQLAQSFATNILCMKGSVRPVSVNRFNLDRLRRRQSFDSDASDGIRR
jgi:hypothetical protein